MRTPQQDLRLDRPKAPGTSLLEEVLCKVLMGLLKWTCHKPVGVGPQLNFRFQSAEHLTPPGH